MKVILYMTTTMNGYIAKENNDTPWSKKEWERFSKYVRKIENIIIGRKTYEIMKKANEFRKIGNPFTIVLTKDKLKPDKNTIFVKSPKEAIVLLKKRGFKQALITGGGITNSSFLKENLIDEIIIDIEPQIFGKGIKLFADNNFEKRLKLMKISKLSKDLIQLHYKILK